MPHQVHILSAAHDYTLILFTVGVPWRDMADDGTVDEGRDNFYYVLNNVIRGNHLPCPNAVIPLLPELPQVSP